MSSSFDQEKAKKFLLEKEALKKEEGEKCRLEMLEKTLNVLKQEFQNTKVEVFLVGSIIQPYQFHSHSDIDIVLKNFEGDRFDIWGPLERLMGRPIEIILYEKCSFQDHVQKVGLKVI